jgi:hypothetical protein
MQVVQVAKQGSIRNQAIQLISEIGTGCLHYLVTRSWKVCGNLLVKEFLMLQPFLKILHLCLPQGACRIESVIIVFISASPLNYLFV